MQASTLPTLEVDIGHGFGHSYTVVNVDLVVDAVVDGGQVEDERVIQWVDSRVNLYITCLAFNQSA